MLPRILADEAQAYPRRRPQQSSDGPAGVRTITHPRPTANSPCPSRYSGTFAASSYRDIFLEEQARDFLETHIPEPSYCPQEY
jgi:hypothetical protein